MKKNKGFTLVELLAVIVVLAIILAIAIPSVLGLISKSKKDNYTTQVGLIKNAAKLYVAEKGLTSDNISLSVADLISGNLLDSNIKNPVTNEPFNTGMNISIIKTGNTIEYGIYEGPELPTGMIPVYHDGTVWRKADKSNANNQWYDYNNFKWANAVTVVEGSRSLLTDPVGTQVNITTDASNDVNTMFVWIPRYKYLIPAGTGAREIKVIFETKYDSKSTGNAVDNYYTHPAFTLGTTELNGLWIGKFETTGSLSEPTIRPNLTALTFRTVSVMFTAIQNMKLPNNPYGINASDLDSHMMKNTEWGAIAYLSHSRYGKYGNASYLELDKEIYINNSSNFITGRSMGTYGGNGPLTPTNEYISNGYYTYDGKCATINTPIPECATGSINQGITTKKYSYGASTTGTIYGIYDMSGGAWEYVMGIYKPNPVPATGIVDLSGYSSTTTNSQYNLLAINNKYYNQYLTNVEATGAILGDATKEVTERWYGDYDFYLTNVYPWYLRGGIYRYGTGAGIFNFDYYDGGAYNDVSFRIVFNLENL